MDTVDRILGTLYGQAIGDAMGMPSELWPVEQIKKQFKGKITQFLDGPANNDVAVNFTYGQYTDDTNQALAILDSLIETDWQPDSHNLVAHIMKWANEVGAWNHNILGPSSKAALMAIKNGDNPSNITDKALTNGAGMRIAPIGVLYRPEELDALVQMVYDVTKITHSSDVAISGASMIAGAVSGAIADFSWDGIIKHALDANDRGLKMGTPTWAAKNHDRVILGIELAHKFSNNDTAFCTAIYNLIGTGTMISESIPTAIAMAYYAKDVKKCALLSANLGGDTDTIGAMATAICGAKQGYHTIDQEWIDIIDRKNPEHHFYNYAEKMSAFIKK